MPQQLTFDLPAKPALGQEDFFVSSANAIAVSTLEAWQDWPSRKMVLTGAAGSGKTHLAHVWAIEANARVVDAQSLPTEDISAFAAQSVAVEDIDRVAGNAAAEEALFHLHNLTIANGHSLLLTTRVAPTALQITLPDLASRMQGTAVVALDAPDDALLTAVMLKLFSDRQLQINPAVIDFLIKRIERSFVALQTVVEQLDKAALSKRQAITVPLATRVLDNLDGDSA
ncbi:HdaA/DnaA family protein [Aliiroseovarius sp. YM-037]|uniref:HdaA/DnaA family protein n=1 Tax=Aliiroseovarius sp. YM-037 TaxID=3341728 RepID=UPI003A7FB898